MVLIIVLLVWLGCSIRVRWSLMCVVILGAFCWSYVVLRVFMCRIVKGVGLLIVWLVLVFWFWGIIILLCCKLFVVCSMVSDCCIFWI